ncbi:NAD-dependent epimerase/dehydratase family protein [Metabacillus idriensis]|uniref:NAD-dependent epimerase/dehydratase family protein n=1 Tax=Metabacillus idriensis TaxID=324768 RepID=UPI00174BA52E|nr:NAD-dependent epimerase/dehydratase family protein [Metabacillus idriensis]
MTSKMKMVITGSSGFTGQHACLHFLKSGFDVTAVARKHFTIGKEIHIEICDLTDKESVSRLIKAVQPHYLLHLAGQNHVGKSWSDPISTLEANAMSTAYLMNTVQKVNPECKIVVVGSALQFDPKTIASLTHPYSLSKTLQVLIAQAWSTLYNMNIVIAKPTNLIGPGLSNGVCSIFAKKIAEMEEEKIERNLNVHNVNAQRDFIDVRDAVSAYEILFHKGNPGDTYEVSSGKSRSIGEIINVYKDLTNIHFDVTTQLNDQFEEPIRIAPSKLDTLGWKPAISIERSLKDALDFYRNFIVHS